MNFQSYLVSLACGGSSSDNNTYIVQASATTVTSPCKHTICPASTNICRIRYDFTTFVTAGPQTGTGMLAVGTAVTDTVVGSCFDDAFSVSSPGNEGSPIICGTNSGYHMYVDVTPSNCQQAVFQIGPSTSTTRQWDILVFHRSQQICIHDQSNFSKLFFRSDNMLVVILWLVHLDVFNTLPQLLVLSIATISLVAQLFQLHVSSLSEMFI